MIKITREGIGNIVLLSWEPLGVLLDARFEEEGGMMLCCLNANLRLDECIKPFRQPRDTARREES